MSLMFVKGLAQMFKLSQEKTKTSSLVSEHKPFLYKGIVETPAN